MPRSSATAERVDGPENRAAEVPRDPRGRMLPGTTLNPGGRPKAWKEFQQAVRERTPEALAILDKALKSRDPAQRRWAAEKVLAYAWGRPPQRVQVGADEDAPPPLPGPAVDWSLLPTDKLRELLAIIGLLEAQRDGPQ